jgi:hypothetical protein
MSRAILTLCLALGAVLLSLPAYADGMPKRKDKFAQPQTMGNKLKLFGFWGPGFRATLEHRGHLEEDMSEYWLQAWGDANYGYSEASVHADVRVFVFAFGASAGYHYDWHFLQFEPDANGLDHGQQVLNRDARQAKDDDADFGQEHWPWYEGRFTLFLPFYDWLDQSIFAVRYEDRPDNSYDWFNATVMDGGVHVRWENLLLYRHKSWGFVGPAFRLMIMPRTLRGGERRHELEFHYGVAAGTSPGWSSDNDVILFRLYAAFGTDPDDLYGTHVYGMPIQFVLGYQTDIGF